MRYTKWFASFAIMAGMAVAGTTAASAQDYRDLRHDYNRINRMQADGATADVMTASANCTTCV